MGWKCTAAQLLSAVASSRVARDCSRVCTAPCLSPCSHLMAAMPGASPASSAPACSVQAVSIRLDWQLQQVTVACSSTRDYLDIAEAVRWSAHTVCISPKYLMTYMSHL